MEQHISLFFDFFNKTFNLLIPFIVSIALIIIFTYYLFGSIIIHYYMKIKFTKIFSLPQSLENEMKNFKNNKTKLIFHFKQIFKSKKSYNSI